MRSGNAQFVEHDLQIERIGGCGRDSKAIEPCGIECLPEAFEVIHNHPAPLVRHEGLDAERAPAALLYRLQRFSRQRGNDQPQRTSEWMGRQPAQQASVFVVFKLVECIQHEDERTPSRSALSRAFANQSGKSRSRSL